MIPEKPELADDDVIPIYYDRKRRRREGFARVMEILHVMPDGWVLAKVIFTDSIKGVRWVWFEQK